MLLISGAAPGTEIRFYRAVGDAGTLADLACTIEATPNGLVGGGDAGLGEVRAVSYVPLDGGPRRVLRCPAGIRGVVTLPP